LPKWLTNKQKKSFAIAKLLRPFLGSNQGPAD
jgi:hypothetical protein